MSEHGERIEQIVNQVDETIVRSHRRRTLLGGLAAGAGLALGVGVVAGATGLFDPFIRWAVRGDGPYVQLNWDSTTVPDNLPWQHFDRDPDAGPLPNAWKKIGLLATQAETLDRQRRETGGQHAVAFRTSDKTMQVGTLAKGQPFFTSQQGDPDRYVVGARVGGGDLDATLGLWLPDQQAFVAPTTGVEMAGEVTVGELQQKNSRVIYV